MTLLLAWIGCSPAADEVPTHENAAHHFFFSTLARRRWDRDREFGDPKPIGQTAGGERNRANMRRDLAVATVDSEEEMPRESAAAGV
jgi:hypothetical protein